MKRLIKKAIAAQKLAYAPYSQYAVGAALMTTSGKIYTGSNVESASYSLTMCAERNAIFKSVTEGHRDIATLVVVTKDSGFPCGACRQVMNEFNPNMVIIVANSEGKTLFEKHLYEILPHAFGPSNLA